MQLQLSDSVLSSGFIITAEDGFTFPVGLNIQMLESRFLELHIPLRFDNRGHLVLSFITEHDQLVSFKIKFDTSAVYFVPEAILECEKHQKQLSLVMNLIDMVSFDGITLRPSRIYTPGLTHMSVCL